MILGRFPFSTFSENLGGFRERMLSQAFDRMLYGKSDILALDNHDPAKPIGRRSTKTLLFSKERHGLAMEIFPPRTSYTADLEENIRRRNIAGVSPRFFVLAETWHVEDGVPIRTITDMEVAEMSIVTFPAYPQTTVELRSQPDMRPAAVMPRVGRTLAMARARQRQAVAMELRSLPEDRGTVMARGGELAMLRWSTGEQVARPKALRSAAAFLDACKARYGSLEETPLDSPHWNERSGWADEGAGKDALRARKMRQERAMREAAASDQRQAKRDRDAQRAAANWQRTMAEWRARNYSTPTSR